MKKIIAALTLSLSTLFASGAQAQEFDLNAVLSDLSAGCSAVPGDCAALTAAAMQTIRASGLPPSVINQNIGAVVSTLIAVSRAAPPAVRAQLASAVAVAADPEVGFVGTSAQVQQQIAAVQTIATSLSGGEEVSGEVVSQLGSAS
ncbi:hypothetical protein CLV80_10424 [Yoonia maritima]|uniref:Secreted protein n=1 Tax=Yoonia maritima TaxID=1435347 RepID=A0A2T0VZS2_9RHOB|nr:hypothetical protein [Yoonia maritima]PRY78062.1 hypothetical protein CLV80_10424 [Yoonia maritima]